MGYDSGKYFWRNGICCLLTENDAGIWWGHIGLVREHPRYGDGYIVLRPQAVAKPIMPVMLSGEVMESKWWLGFEGGYSQSSTMEILKRVADQLAVSD